MFVIAIPFNEVPLLEVDGCNLKINGEATVLRRTGDYLCYEGNRCKILDQHRDGDLVHFAAASDGDEDLPYVVIRPE